MRNISSGVLAELSAGRCRPFYLAEIQFTSGVSRMWTGIGNITWNSQTWIGLGSLAQVSAISQNSDVSAENITLTLSGIPSDLVSQAINECRQNYSVQVWLGFLNDSNQIIVDPVLLFSGHMDVPTVQDGGETCTILITAENPLVDLQRSSSRRYTHDDQQIAFPGDRGFQFVASIQTWNGVWGRPGAGGGSSSGSGGGVRKPSPRDNF